MVLSPLYLVSEFVIRRPVGGLISFAERSQVPEALYNFFTFTPDHKVGIVPTFFVDFGFKPSAGLYFFWDDFWPMATTCVCTRRRGARSGSLRA